MIILIFYYENLFEMYLMIIENSKALLKHYNQFFCHFCKLWTIWIFFNMA